jgi:hypothetical protein
LAIRKVKAAGSVPSREKLKKWIEAVNKNNA